MSHTGERVIENDNMGGLVRGMRVGPYEITGFIGAGGMGEEYRRSTPSEPHRGAQTAARRICQ